MKTYTSSLPDRLWKELSRTANELNIPKNKIIEKAISKYLGDLKRQAYIDSYKRAAGDPELLSIAEEGMGDYLAQLKKWDETE